MRIITVDELEVWNRANRKGNRGLKDTVEAYNEYEHTGTGFSFANYNAHEMLGTIRYAISVFRDRKKDWNGLIQRGMKQDFSWNRSAGKYEALYEKLTDFE